MCTESSLGLRKKNENFCTETPDLGSRKKFEKTLKFCAQSSLGLQTKNENFLILATALGSQKILKLYVLQGCATVVLLDYLD